MIVPDVNILIYAHVTDMPHHVHARDWWSSAINGNESIGLAWSVMTGFIRLTTTTSLFTQPLSIDQACSVVDSWLQLPHSVTLQPSQDHLNHVRSTISKLKSGGSVVPDVHLAALAFEYGGTVYSADNDFARFGLAKWINPVA